MPAGRKPARLTVDLRDRRLYRAIRRAAIERGQPVRQIVVEALREWLERREEEDDLAAIAEAENDPTLPWEEVREEMRAAPQRRPSPYVATT